LSYTSKDKTAATITKSGVIMTDFENSQAKCSIIFTIERTHNGFNLHGIKETAWTSLNFNCVNENCKQGIDQNGLVSK
jgi:hypothetical protein